MSKDKKKKRFSAYNIIRYIIMAVAAVTFTYASYSLTKSYLEYKVGDDAYDRMDDLFMEYVEESDDGDDKDNSVSLGGKTEKWVWNFEKMVSMNKQAVGFIRQDSTKIQYPIMQGTDNEYYLTHLYDGTYNKNGAIFVDYQIKEGLNAQNTIVYGHNMWTDTMFGTLVNYKEKAYCEEHPSFDVYIGEKHYKYYAFASFEAEAVGDRVYQYAFATDEEFESWQREIRSRSYYQVTTVPELTSKDKIMTLSTCTTRNDQSKRVIVMCVRGEEVID